MEVLKENINDIKNKIIDSKKVLGKLEIYNLNINKIKEKLNEKANVSDYRNFITKNTDNLAELLYRLNEFLTDAFYNNDKGMTVLNHINGGTTEGKTIIIDGLLKGYRLPSNFITSEITPYIFNNSIITYPDNSPYVQFRQFLNNEDGKKALKIELRNYSIETLRFLGSYINYHSNSININDLYKKLTGFDLEG